MLSISRRQLPSIDFAPVEIENLAAPASCEGDHADHLGCGRHLLVRVCLAQKVIEKPVFVLGEAPIALLVGGLADPVGGVALDDPVLARIGEDGAEQADRASARAGAAAYNGASSLPGLLVQPGAARRDVSHEAGDVCGIEILDAARAKQRDDVALDPAFVGVDGRRLLRPAPLAEDEAGLCVLQISFAQLFDRDGLDVELLLFGRIAAVRDVTEKNAGLLAGGLGRPHTVRTDGEATGSPLGAILDDIAAAPRGEDPDAEFG